VDEISLLISPVIVGKKAKHMFHDIHDGIKLKRTRYEVYDDGHIRVTYEIEK